MTVKVSPRTITVEDPQGNKITVEATDKIQTKTPVTMTCDGPKCGSRFQANNPTIVEWVEEEVQQHPELLPDAFWGFIRMGINPANPKELSFCGPQCAKDYLTYSYVAPKSYKEQMETIKKATDQALAMSEALKPKAPTVEPAISVASE